MEDLTGKTFNGLTGLRPGSLVPGKFNTWVWKCVCGNEVEYRSCVVVSGHIKSCGCRRHHQDEPSGPCKSCGQEHNRRTPKGRLASLCQKCQNKKCNHSDTPVVYLLARARQRARAAGLPFSITREDIVIPDRCPIFDIPLSWSGMKERNSSPSLDRLVPELGYVRGNIAIISHLANRIKNTGTADEHRLIADWMDAQTKAAE